MTKKQRIMGIRLAVSAILFLAAVVTESKSAWSLLFYLFAYLSAGYDIPDRKSVV